MPVGVDAGTEPPSIGPALRLGTLRSVTEAVAPTPTALTLGLSSADEIRSPAEKQTLATTREPLQEALSSVVLPGLVQIEIVRVTLRSGGVR